MTLSRREFLVRSGCGALSVAALASGIERFSMVEGLAQGSGYKVLVCIFLGGGNDGNNLVVPLDAAGYAAYSGIRGAAGLAIAQGSLLPVTPRSIGTEFGLHPSLAAVHPLFAGGQLAVVSNVGPLIEPLLKQDYLNGAPRPYQLFSHSDQIAQWQTSISTSAAATGWGGRMADTFPVSPSGYPLIAALAGGVFTRGQSTSPVTVAPAPTPLTELLVLDGFGAAADEQARLNAMNYLRTIDLDAPLVAAASKITQQAVDIGKDFDVDPVLNTEFPATSLGNQLKQVAKLIKFNLASGVPALARQIFFCSLGGFDTHQGQVSTQASLLTQVGEGMKAFYDATVELHVQSDVTTFTLSDFGRTMQPAGSSGTVGSDHAWGNHHFVMGASVVGGDFYGIPGPNGAVFPTLQLGGPDDTDTRGRWIPTSSVDQYAFTLATWFGVDPAKLDTVFPELKNFPIRNLRFMV
ncbi:MAG TPA: DUF1501 domain-containing protein [Terriglobia bacterium]|nr:DUF1501 domain-containing protein [Terriglobia bacterium]